MTERHLVTVWKPAPAVNAMEQHLAVWRNRLLGVGCTGDFVELGTVRPR